MSAVMNRVTEWLNGFEGASGAERVTEDLLAAGDTSLSDLPPDSSLVYVDGTRDMTAYALFRLRRDQPMEAQELLYAFEREVWQRNLRHDLPQDDAQVHFQSVTVSGRPRMVETGGEETVFQFGLEIRYIDTAGAGT